MAVLVYNLESDAEQARDFVVNFVKFSKQHGDPTIFEDVEVGDDGRFYILVPDNQFDKTLLEADASSSEMPSSMKARILGEAIDGGVDVGAQLIRGFIASAHSSGVNEIPNLPTEIVETLLLPIVCCLIGSLHGARGSLEKIKLVPESTRGGMPFTSDRSLEDLITTLNLAIGED